MADVVFFEEPLRRLLVDPDGEVARHLTRLAVTVQNEARRLCPVDTGRLRSSITHQVRTDPRGVVARVGTNVVYAPFIELGTRFAEAQPFLRPALLAVKRR